MNVYGEGERKRDFPQNPLSSCIETNRLPQLTKKGSQKLHLIEPRVRLGPDSQQHHPARASSGCGLNEDLKVSSAASLLGITQPGGGGGPGSHGNPQTSCLTNPTGEGSLLVLTHT